VVDEEASLDAGCCCCCCCCCGCCLPLFLLRFLFLFFPPPPFSTILHEKTTRERGLNIPAYKRSMLRENFAAIVQGEESYNAHQEKEKEPEPGGGKSDREEEGRFELIHFLPSFLGRPLFRSSSGPSPSRRRCRPPCWPRRSPGGAFARPAPWRERVRVCSERGEMVQHCGHANRLMLFPTHWKSCFAILCSTKCAISAIRSPFVVGVFE